MESEAVRHIALSFPGAVEREHHGFPSFRTARRVFATIPDAEHVHLMLDEHDIREAVAEWPAWCEEKWWGRKLSALRVHLPVADGSVVAELLQDAWEQRS